MLSRGGGASFSHDYCHRWLPFHPNMADPETFPGTTTPMSLSGIGEKKTELNGILEISATTLMRSVKASAWSPNNCGK